MKGYYLTFESGYTCYVAGLSKTEKLAMERKHGKLVKKVKA